MHALSLRQPWAALVAAGLKTIEVRTWPTRRLGPILIHAARLTDDRPAAWQKVPLELMDVVARRGGIVGAVEIVRCVSYRSLAEFVADQARHLNEPAWFQPPRMYGFVFANPRRLPFRPCPGQNRFFSVADETETSS
jgi:hypothetical protein